MGKYRKSEDEKRTDFRLAKHFFDTFITPHMVNLRRSWNGMIRLELPDSDFEGLVPEAFFHTHADGQRLLSYHPVSHEAGLSIQNRVAFLVDMCCEPARAKHAAALYLAVRDAMAYARNTASEVSPASPLRTQGDVLVTLPVRPGDTLAEGRMTLRYMASVWRDAGMPTHAIHDSYAGHPTIQKLLAFNRERFIHREQFDAASRFLQQEFVDSRVARNDALKMADYSAFSVCAAYPDMRETLKLVFGDSKHVNDVYTSASEHIFPKRGADHYNIRVHGAHYDDAARKRARWIETREVLMRAMVAYRSPETKLRSGEMEFFEMMGNE